MQPEENEFTKWRRAQYKAAHQQAASGTYGPHYVDVTQFHLQFGLMPERAAPLEKNLARKRADQMREELREFEDACADNDPVKAADALADMVYFALGAATMMGISPHCWELVWGAVHHSNMQKERVPGLETLKQGIVKPRGWQPPTAAIRRALRADGFEVCWEQRQGKVSPEECERFDGHKFSGGFCVYCDQPNPVDAVA